MELLRNLLYGVVVALLHLKNLSDDGILCVHQITEFFIRQLGLQLFQHTIICFAFIA